MKNSYLSTILFLLLFASMAHAQTSWIVSSSDVSFKIKNAGVTVTGHFAGPRITLLFSADKLSLSSLKGDVDVATLSTGIDKRDEDLQGEKYFNEDKYKKIEMVSTKIYATGPQYTGVFNVTIKGVTKQVEMPFEFTQQGNNGEFKGSFTINRKDYGVGGKSIIMSDEVKVSIDIKASAKQ
jgi:polyisoprenoid-binding protein YceI